MHRGGHAGFNALLYAPFVPIVSHYWSLEMAVWGALIAVGTATIPDLDERTHRIHHRGGTHTIWFAGFVGTVAGAGTVLAAPAAPAASFGFGFVVGTLGVVAHLAGDVVTPMGISPLWPLSSAHVTFDLFASKNRAVNRLLLIVGTLALLASVALTAALTGGLVATVPVTS